MSRSSWILKNSSGWFAAGAEVRQAMLLLSDGAFKLFVYLCLHARRDTGLLAISQTDLARALKKSPGTIRGNLREMVTAGVCRTHFSRHPFGDGRIEIDEAFWPYQRSVPQPHVDEDAETFVLAIRKMLQARACVRGSFSVADEILAREWLVQGVTLQRIEQAILMGCVRKYVAWRNHPTAAPIGSLQYFQPLLEEIQSQKIDADYWVYLRSRLQRLETLWKTAHNKAESPSRKDAACHRIKVENPCLDGPRT